MSPIKVLILEDDDFQAESLAEDLEEHGFTVTGRAKTLQEAVGLFHLQSVDIAIIDIFLDGQPSGIQFAEYIYDQGKGKIPFVFLTGNNEMHIFEQARLTNPHSFLLKPYNTIELIYAIELAVEAANKQSPSSSTSATPTPPKDFIFVKKNHVYHKVFLKNIQYIEVEGRYSKIATADKAFLIQLALKEIEKILPPNDFIRTHRNFIVQKSKIQEIHNQDNLIILEGKLTALIGRKYKEDFLKNNFTLR